MQSEGSCAHAELAGNRMSRAESFAGTTRREAYDAIDQLIESRLNLAGAADERRVGYVYDAAVNRTRVVEDADGTGPGVAQERVYIVSVPRSAS